jgi:hypothetical protein
MDLFEQIGKVDVQHETQILIWIFFFGMLWFTTTDKKTPAPQNKVCV